jgi:hypothetical protein
MMPRMRKNVEADLLLKLEQNPKIYIVQDDAHCNIGHDKLQASINLRNSKCEEVGYLESWYNELHA